MSGPPACHASPPARGGATTPGPARAPSAIERMPRSTISCSLTMRSWSVPSGSVSVASSPAEDLLDAVDAGENQRHRIRSDRHAVTELAHQCLAGVGERFEPRQPEEAASALDGVDQAEDVIQDLGVVRLLLEPHQLIVDGVQALAGLRQKLPQQIVHETGLRTLGRAGSTRLSERGQLLCKAFNIG